MKRKRRKWREMKRGARNEKLMKALKISDIMLKLNEMAEKCMKRETQ